MEACESNGHAIVPTALFLGSTPGMYCEQCGLWETMKRNDFRLRFGKTFGVFRRDDLGIFEQRGDGVRVTTGRTFMYMVGGAYGLSGSSADRRRVRRRLARVKAA